MRRRSLLRAAPLLLAALAAAPAADASRTLEEYRYFRALSIDLNGRMPTRDEVAQFERDDFNVDGWIDQHLTGRAYSERLRQIYMDVLRLEVGTAFQFSPQPLVLRRQQVIDPNGNPAWVYYRQSQRRTNPAVDGDFCFNASESGVQIGPAGTQVGTLHSIPADVWNSRTVTVRPWWLYRDYQSPAPADHYDATWGARFPLYNLPNALVHEPDGTTPTTQVRICREEAQAGATGAVLMTGRTMRVPAGQPQPYDRLVPQPIDDAYARAHHGEPIACGTATGHRYSADCGCGVGLERCMPGDNAGVDPGAFLEPSRTPLGADRPLDDTAGAQSSWHRFWWSEEAEHFLEQIFGADRDFRDVIRAHDTWVNGPLAQFYRNFSSATCCTAATGLNYIQPQPLFNTATLPADLLPQDTGRWVHVDDRGAMASGILTMPVFLTKYGTRRARAHVLYNAFLCRDFIAENLQLMPSTEPNLMIRPGCNTCHTALEPLAAYFSRVSESDWTLLPPAQFPGTNPACLSTTSSLSTSCRTYYDPAFSDPASHALLLRGAYGSMANANLGPPGAGEHFATAPEFASCAVQNVTQAFLGRTLTPDDAALQQQLTAAFTAGGFRMRALVGALVRADAYRHANDLSSTAWRQAGGAR